MNVPAGVVFGCFTAFQIMNFVTVFHLELQHFAEYMI